MTKISGYAGLLVTLGGVVSVPLYFIYSGPPPAWNVLTRNLISILTIVAMLVFLVGIRQVIQSSGPAYDWLADLVYGTGLMYATLSLVATSLEAGPAIANPGQRIDPTTTGPLAVGDILLHGSVQRAITAVLTFAAGYAILRGRSLPRTIGWLAIIVAVANTACIPSLYFGADAAHFYSGLGWGNSALTASLICYWTGAAGIAMLRRPAPAPLNRS